MVTKAITQAKGQQSPAVAQGVISTILNAQRVLPTESAADYKNSLLALITELEANSPLKVYLVENLHECVLWIRRYRTQKQQAILKVSAQLLHQRLNGKAATIGMSSNFSDSDYIFQKLLLSPTGSVVKSYLDTAATTLESLQAEAMTWRNAELSALDEAISKQFRMLQVLQAEFERLENRKLKREYLQLQVENLRRNVNAIEPAQP